jgi:hypothetical protein
LWILQTESAESEVLQTTLPNRLLTFLQNPNITKYRENTVSIRLVYCILRFRFIHYQQHTQFEPTKLQLLPLSKVPTPFSVRVLQDFSTHQQFCALLSPLIYLNSRYNELPSVEWYAGAITINLFLSISYVWPWEFVSDIPKLMSQVLQVCQDIQVQLVKF